MTASDLDFCESLVRSEGWLSETRHTFETFLAHGAAGCLIAQHDGAPVGMCIATTYRANAFLGELIVLPELRGRGIGGSLMKAAIEYARSQGCDSVFLDGDIPAVPLYERLGFRRLWRSVRFVGSADGEPGANVRPMRASDIDQVCGMDKTAFGDDRSFFLHSRFRASRELCLVEEASDGVGGYIFGQPGHGVVTAGPWYAASGSDSALALLRGLNRITAKMNLRIGCLECNDIAVTTLRSIVTLEECEPSIRMVLGPDTGLGTDTRLWAVGSPAKG